LCLFLFFLSLSFFVGADRCGTIRGKSNCDGIMINLNLSMPEPWTGAGGFRYTNSQKSILTEGALYIYIYIYIYIMVTRTQILNVLFK